MNEKQLAQQIKNIEQKQLLPEIELKRIEQEMGGLNTPGEDNLGEINYIQNRINNNEQNTNNETSDETFGIDLDTDIELDLTSGDLNNRPDNIEQQQNSMDIGTDEQSIIYKEDLREIWRKNFEKYINMDIEHREFTTKVTPPATQKNLDILNKIIEEAIMRLEKKHQLDLWTINVIYYTSAVSILQKEGKLKEEKGNKQPKGKPGWQIRHESRIQAIRRKLSYTAVLQQCQRENKYTKHQRNIKQKMEK